MVFNVKFYRKSTLCITLASVFYSGFGFAYSLEKPGKYNTGPLDCECELQAYTGPNTITEDNTVIEGVIFSNTLRINADNVTIRNFVSRPNNYFAFHLQGGENIVIEDGEIEQALSAAVFGSNFTARRLEVHNMGDDGFKGANNFVVENNWIYDLGYVNGSHSDGVQISKGSGAIIRGNFIDMPANAPGFTHSQCIIIKPDQGEIKNVLIENNWLNGGGICLQVRASTHGTPSGLSVIDNRFGEDYEHQPWFFDGEHFKALNVLESTGELLGGQ